MLATPANSLVLASRSRPPHWYSSCDVSFLSCERLLVASQFQALLSHPSVYFSAFPLGTMFAVGLGLCLGLEVNTPRFTLPTRGALLRTLAHPDFLNLQGFHFLSRGFPTHFGSKARIPCKASTPHACAPCGATFGLPSSLFSRLTKGIPVGFFSSAY